MTLPLTYRCLLGGAGFLVVLSPARRLAAQTDAEASREVCRPAYEGAQVLRRQEQLLAARDQLRICGAETCPAIARTDCVGWLGEVEAAIPSVVFEARTSAGAAFDVTAKVDGVVRAHAFDGQPIELDPGLHTFSFERRGSAPIEQKVIVREGQKSRLVVADWRTERPVPTSVYVTAAIAALGFTDFVIAASLGNSLKSDLEASGCAPFCARDRADALTARYVVADLGLTLGIAELATSAFLFLTRPEHPGPASGGVAKRTRAFPWNALEAVPSASGVTFVWRSSL